MKVTGSMAAVVVGILAVVVLIAAGVVGIVLTSTLGPSPAIVLPLFAVGGMLLLLSALALVAIAFSLFNLADKSQALGLPEGSVRAVIALSLVVLFAILSVYLYADLARSGTVVATSTLDDTAKDDAEKRLGDQVIYVETIPGTAPKDPPKYIIHYRDAGSVASQDFAKQMLVLLGTLVTAVSSFYFGAKTVTSAQNAAANALSQTTAPKITSVDPSTWSVAAGPITVLTISGTGLDVVTKVRIAMSGQADIVGSPVKSAVNVVTCALPIAATTATGKWDVVLSNDANDLATQTGGLTLTT